MLSSSIPKHLTTLTAWTRWTAIFLTMTCTNFWDAIISWIVSFVKTWPNNIIYFQL